MMRFIQSSSCSVMMTRATSAQLTMRSNASILAIRANASAVMASRCVASFLRREKAMKQISSDPRVHALFYLFAYLRFQMNAKIWGWGVGDNC